MNFQALLNTFSNSTSLESGNDQIIRHNAFSGNGQKAIDLYGKAVREMKRRDNAPLDSGRVDPTSWKYQAAIHGTFWETLDELQNNATKENDNNFFNTKSELKDGDSTLNNCTHFSKLWNTPIRDTLNPGQGFNENKTMITDITINFLPWHRLYLQNFESIVRSVLKDLSKVDNTITLDDAETWGLPYWEYTQEGQDTIPGGGFTDPSNQGGLYEKSRSQIMQIEGKGLSDLQQPEQTVMLQYDLYDHLREEKDFISIFDFQVAGVEKSKEQNQFAAFATYHEQNPHNNFHDALGGIADNQTHRQTLWKYTTDYAANDNRPLWGYNRNEGVNTDIDHQEQYSQALKDYSNVLGGSDEVTVGPGLIGYVPAAARDPLFWMHHAYIDKVWSEWNATTNAAYLFAEDLAISPWNYEFYQANPSGDTVLKTYSKWGENPNAVVSSIYNPNYSYDELTNEVTETPNPVLALIDNSNYRPTFQTQTINRTLTSLKNEEQGFLPLELDINLTSQEILNLRKQGINITAKIRYKAQMNASHNIAIFAGSNKFFKEQGLNLKTMWESYSSKEGFGSQTFNNGKDENTLLTKGIGGGEFQPYQLNHFAVGQISLLPMSGSSTMQMPGEYHLDLSESVYRQNEFANKNNYNLDNDSPLAFLFASSDSLNASDAGSIANIEYLLDANFPDAADIAASNFDAVAYVAEHPELLKLFANSPDNNNDPEAILNPEDYFNQYGQALGHTAPRMNHRAAAMGMQYLMNNPSLLEQASSSPYRALEHYLDEGMQKGNALTYDGELTSHNWLCNCSDNNAALLDFSQLNNGNIVVGDVITGRDADYSPTVGFYQLTDRDGTVTVGGQIFKPGDSGYTKAATDPSNLFKPLTGFNADNGKATTMSAEFTIDGNNQLLAPFAEVNGNVYFSFAAANSDGVNHFTQLAPNVLGLEDLPGGGDQDFDDLLIGFNLNAV